MCRFVLDLLNSAPVVGAILNITQATSAIAAAANKHIESWKSLSYIWKSDKESLINGLQVKPGNCRMHGALFENCYISSRFLDLHDLDMLDQSQT